ncbi:MAG TPA: IPT/TIG domain-containing protein [Phnomibacter sp.]|nr:IPT/TIG domain-containing protein [Phnomibacter sp.]
MRYLFSAFLLFTLVFNTQAQVNLAGSYKVTGYLFHPTTSRSINLTKTITQVSTNRYKVDFGDLGGSNFSFQFDVDANNNLVNWVATGGTPALPASNFMTLDNPGNFTYTAPILPGTNPYQSSIYNNTYNPATQTFYMHYGYAGGSTSQNGFTRQVYETWQITTPPVITGISPVSGTAFTQVTISGHHFLNTDPAQGISFGNTRSDSAVVVSDSVIIAWVGSGASGNVIVRNADGADTLSGFSYTPVGAITNTQWEYLGAAGLSAGKANSVNATVDKNNIPYVVFSDSATGKARVIKYDGASWINVGNDVSDGKSNNTKIETDTANLPIVVFADSTKGGALTVKKYNGSNWTNLTAPTVKGNYAMTIDALNNLYIAAIDTLGIKVLKYDGANWAVTSNVGGSYYGGLDIVTDKNNIPYLLFDDYNFAGNPTVKKLDGGSWVNVGAAGFTSSSYGIFYPNIKIDTSGNPIVAFQQDNGFERVSAYKFAGGVWSPVGNPYFSKSHSYHVSLAIDKRNNTSVAFFEDSYNKQTTVRSLNTISGIWDTTGSRGGIPAKKLEQKALITDHENTKLIAFSDASNGGKLSVMRLIVNTSWTGSGGSGWENPANWSSGIVPTSSTSVTIPPGATVVLNTSTTIHSLTVSPGSSLTVAAGSSILFSGKKEN